MPAQVSGPGAYAKRTDTGGQPIRSMPEPEYGEQTAFKEQQQGAPMAESTPRNLGGTPDTAAAVEMAPMPELPGLFDEGDPTIPTTAGAPIGAGPNVIDGLPGGDGTDFQPQGLREGLEPFAIADQSGILASVINALSERGMW